MKKRPQREPISSNLNVLNCSDKKVEKIWKGLKNKYL
jgi:hypothetical protein